MLRLVSGLVHRMLERERSVFVCSVKFFIDKKEAVILCIQTIRGFLLGYVAFL